MMMCLEDSLAKQQAVKGTLVVRQTVKVMPEIGNIQK
jgi:hypothetical protein